MSSNQNGNNQKYYIVVVLICVESIVLALPRLHYPLRVYEHDAAMRIHSKSKSLDLFLSPSAWEREYKVENWNAF